MLAQLAWRNLWRNPRRTALTLVAVAGCLVGLLAFDGLLAAFSDRMLEGVTGSYMGHVQVHREGYREDRDLAATLTETAELLGAVRAAPEVEAAAARAYGFSQASVVRGEDEAIRHGRGEDVAAPVAILVGVEPDAEGAVTDLPEKVRQGRWLRDGAEVVVGSGLAERYGLGLGDAFLPTVVAANGGVRGPWAVGDEVPRIVGILRSGIEVLDRQTAILPRGYLEQLEGLGGEAHEIVVRGRDPEDLAGLTRAVRDAVAAPSDAAAQAELAVTSSVVVRSVEGREGAAAQARLVGVPVGPAGADGSGALASGRWPERADQMALGRALAARLAVAPGSRVVVEVPVACGDDVPPEECPPSEEPFEVTGLLAEGAPFDGAVGLVSERVLTENVAGLAPGLVSTVSGPEADSIGTGLFAATAPRAAEVLPWDEIAPEVRDIVTFMEAMPLLFGVIIYFAVVLGILNTLLMATFERLREFGVMLALGMRPRRLVGLVLAESAMLAAVGAVIGAVLGAALVGYWGATGLDLSAMTGGESMAMGGVELDSVLWPRLRPADVAGSVALVGVMTVVAGLWPALRAARAQPTEALRQE